MTKTHFEAMARIISDRAARNRALVQETEHDKTHDAGYMTALRGVAVDLADYFEAENPRFNREMFLTACGIV